jgi:hypothetical protein
MSAIASFVLLPKSRIGELLAALDREAGKEFWTDHPYHDCLAEHGRQLADYEWSGWVLGTLLAYLQEQCQIDLMASEFEDLCARIIEQCGGTSLFLTAEHKRQYLDKLEPSLFSEEELGEYYNQFNESDEPGAGEPMLAGIRCLHDTLAQVDDDSVVICSIG